MPKIHGEQLRVPLTFYSGEQILLDIQPTYVNIPVINSGSIFLGVATQYLPTSSFQDYTASVAGVTHFTKDYLVSLSGGKSVGRYTTGQTIPSAGLTAEQLLALISQEPINPTVSLTSSTVLGFNQIYASSGATITLNRSYTINSAAPATVTTCVLEWRRNNTGAWTTLSSSTVATPFNHNVTDTQFNTAPFNYRYTVTDSLGAVTVQTLDITPQAYVAPSITFTAPAVSLGSIDSNTIREKGNTSSSLQGSWTRNSTYVTMSSYQFSVSTNGGSTYTNIGASNAISGSSAAFTTYTDASITTSPDSVIYRVGVTDQYQTTYSTYTITYKYVIFYGPSTAVPTTSANIRALGNKLFLDGTNPLHLFTGTTQINFVVAMPNTKSITNVSDLTVSGADITSQYVLSGTLTAINDAGGNSSGYKVYVMSTALAYSPQHDHQITRN